MGGIEIELCTSVSGLYWWCLVVCESIHNIQENKEASAVISKGANQEVSAKLTKCVYMSCEQNAGKNHNVKIGSKSCENIVKFRYVGATLTNQNCIREPNKNKVNSRNT